MSLYAYLAPMFLSLSHSLADCFCSLTRRVTIRIVQSTRNREHEVNGREDGIEQAIHHKQRETGRSEVDSSDFYSA